MFFSHLTFMVFFCFLFVFYVIIFTCFILQFDFYNAGFLLKLLYNVTRKKSTNICLRVGSTRIKLSGKKTILKSWTDAWTMHSGTVTKYRTLLLPTRNTSAHGIATRDRCLIASLYYAQLSCFAFYLMCCFPKIFFSFSFCFSSSSLFFFTRYPCSSFIL